MKQLVIGTIALLSVALSVQSQEKVIRLGMVGLDTSHVIAFTEFLNDPNNPNHVPGAKVVAGFKGGSPDIESSISRVDGYTKQLQEKWGVKIYDTIEELCQNVDGVLIESVDGRPHLEQARKVIAAGKPMFIDKPVAGTFEDILEIARLAKKAGVPWFGGSSLRFVPQLQAAIKPEKVGDILGCDAYAPCEIEPHHPDLYWYGVHGVEILYTVMGRGCKQVTRTHTQDADIVVGVWEDGRIGTFRGMRHGAYGFGAAIFGTKATVTTEGHSYKGIIEEIVKFFQTGKPPIDPLETLELMAFMSKADESKAKDGAAVEMPEISLE